MDCAGDEAAEAVPVEPRRRGGAGGEPVKADRVEHRVTGQRIFGMAADRLAARLVPAIGPAMIFLDDPGHLTGGCVGQRIAAGLRPRRLLRRLAAVLRLLPLEADRKSDLEG